METPKQIHDFEQMFTSVRNLATYYGTFYRELCNYMDKGSALQVTLGYVREFSALGRTPSPPKPDEPGKAP